MPVDRVGQLYGPGSIGGRIPQLPEAKTPSPEIQLVLASFRVRRVVRERRKYPVDRWIVECTLIKQY
jgi:hypothetical protein